MNSAACTTKEKVRCPPILWYIAAKQAGTQSRLGITTGVKLGNAVKRNFVRRRIRELYRTNEEKFLPGFDIVVVARTRAIFGRYRELERSFLQQMKKLGLMAQSDKKEDRP